MGRLYERFRHMTYENEADVSQNLVVPLCTEFLGYTENELLPERPFPAVKIPRNRERELDAGNAKIKPDHIVAVDGELDNIVFVNGFD